MSDLVLGIDVGTQSARVIALNAEGIVKAEAFEGFAQATSALPYNYFEQNSPENMRISMHASGRNVLIASLVDISAQTTQVYEGYVRYRI
ncbi:MAG: hypothetical protein GX811_10730 [Lentisphaerae bacterium]|nr:hypothetical protein [Lentisphaerota bacterium]